MAAEAVAAHTIVMPAKTEDILQVAEGVVLEMPVLIHTVMAAVLAVKPVGLAG